MSQDEPQLLFVEVRGTRPSRAPGLLYDKSRSELKRHVTLFNTTMEKRKRQERDQRELLATQRANRLCPKPNSRHADPFDTLPVEGTFELHAAIKFGTHMRRPGCASGEGLTVSLQSSKNILGQVPSLMVRDVSAVSEFSLD